MRPPVILHEMIDEKDDIMRKAVDQLMMLGKRLGNLGLNSQSEVHLLLHFFRIIEVMMTRNSKQEK